MLTLAARGAKRRNVVRFSWTMQPSSFVEESVSNDATPEFGIDDLNLLLGKSVCIVRSKTIRMEKSGKVDVVIH